MILLQTVNAEHGILENMGTYEFFDHVADVGIRIRGESLEDLFTTAAAALMAWMGPPPAGPTMLGAVVVEAADREELFVRWLQEILYRFHLQHAYLIGVQDPRLDLERGRMEASLLSRTWSDRILAEYQEYQEVKAITYHQLRIEQQGAEWSASVILDV